MQPVRAPLVVLDAHAVEAHLARFERDAPTLRLQALIDEALQSNVSRQTGYTPLPKHWSKPR